MKAVIFPGQGAQYVGMGASFYDNFDEAKEIFSKIDSVAGLKLSEKCFCGPAQDLKDTAVQQLAILAVSVVAYRIFKDSVGDAGIGYVSGLSLGEYSCLYAAGVLSLEDLVVLVKKRACAMQKAATINPSAMFAVIGLDIDTLRKKEKGGLFFIANINSPSQIAISLKKEDKDRVKELLAEAGAKRVIELEVSGGFHSPFMEPALKDLKKVIDNLGFRQAKIPIVSNFNAKGSKDAAEIKENLLRQLVSTVLWKDCVEFMVNNGTGTFYEVGPSRILRGLLRKITPQAEVVNIENKQDLEALISA